MRRFFVLIRVIRGQAFPPRSLRLRVLIQVSHRVAFKAVRALHFLLLTLERRTCHGTVSDNSTDGGGWLGVPGLAVWRRVWPGAGRLRGPQNPGTLIAS